MNYLIGCGGVGSFLAPSLAKLVGASNLTLVDGDTLEEKNLDRQLFDVSSIGLNKAAALGEKYGLEWLDAYYYNGLIQELAPSDWLLVAVDNHPARAAVLESCDHYRCRAIFAANETHSSEAYVYLPAWGGTDLDPRRYYPEILTVKTGDPLARQAGCTGEAQEANRQLVSANFSAAALAQHLYVVWALESKHMDQEAWPYIPHKLVCNLTKLTSYCQADGENRKE